MKPLAERKRLIEADHAHLSISRQCRLLSMARSSYYYSPQEWSRQDLALMHRMDRLYQEDPTRGSRRYAADLRREGYHVGREKVRRLMRVMRIKAIYCRPRTTTADPAAYKYPYLLRGLQITRPNQVWQIDITYVPMHKGFMYLVAIIDVYSRYIVGWDVANSMEAEWVVSVLSAAVDRHGAPDIMNSDQGSQFTGETYIAYVKSLKATRISMDGRGRATDNAYVERFFRTIKHEKIYLHLPENGQDLFKLCSGFIIFYNTRRSHSRIGEVPPQNRYLPAA